MAKTYQWQNYQIEPTGKDSGHCNCCQTKTQKIWGFIHQEEITIAAYFVGWTIDSPDHGATFDLILGSWGEGTSSTDRAHAALNFGSASV